MNLNLLIIPNLEIDPRPFYPNEIQAVAAVVFFW
jgi:hypothetical protein